MTTKATGSRKGGFTLVEVMISVAVMALVGLMIFLVLNVGMVLYAKNTAVNSAHQQARSGVDEMLSKIHSAVSIPELVDTNLQPVSELDGSGQPASAAGISFQTFYAGTYPVVKTQKSTDTSITLYCPAGYTNVATTRLNIPTHGIELDISSVHAKAGSQYQFNFASQIGNAITISGNGKEGGAGVSYLITAFITTRVSYAVVGSDLRFFPTNDTSSYKTVARGIISPTPFSVPLMADGGLQNRFVAAVNLSSVEPNYSQRGYAAVNMFISSLVPFRCRLTNLQ